MVPVRELWPRFANWDERRPARRAPSPRRVLVEGLCPVVILLLGLAEMLFGGLDGFWFAWVFASVLVVLLGLSIRLAAWRWRRELARN
jgi:hypothetical protein